MSEFTYAGAMPRSYVETRDATGAIVGPVAYGDTREFDREWVPPEPADGEDPEEAPQWWPAPDAEWFPSDAELPLRLPEEERAEEEAPAADTGKTPDTPPATPRLPVTPAATPPASTTTTPAASSTTEEG